MATRYVAAKPLKSFITIVTIAFMTSVVITNAVAPKNLGCVSTKELMKFWIEKIG